MTTIMPTHSCFDDAIDFIAWRVKEDPSARDRLILVHAICLAPEGPKKDSPFAHAWVLAGDRAYQDGFIDGQRITYSCDAAALEQSLRIQAATRYTVDQAMEENRRSGTYGPWKPEYIALARRADEAPEVYRP